MDAAKIKAKIRAGKSTTGDADASIKKQKQIQREFVGDEVRYRKDMQAMLRTTQHSIQVMMQDKEIKSDPEMQFLRDFASSMTGLSAMVLDANKAGLEGAKALQKQLAPKKGEPKK